MLVPPNDVGRCAFEPQPCEISRKSANQRLRKRQNNHEQSRAHSVEFRLDLSAHHVGKRYAKRAAHHQVRNDSERRQKDAQAKKKNRQRKPFNAAQVRGYIRLWRGINRLEKSFTENPVINHRTINEPAEPRRAINLTTPFRRAGWPEKDQMLEAKQRLGFPVPILLFYKSAKCKTSIMPDNCGWTESNDAACLQDE